MEIKRIGSQSSAKGPADWFTGTVRIDPLFAESQSEKPVAEWRMIATINAEPD
jgi:hypothetical protein